MGADWTIQQTSNRIQKANQIQDDQKKFEIFNHPHDAYINSTTYGKKSHVLVYDGL